MPARMRVPRLCPAGVLADCRVDTGRSTERSFVHVGCSKQSRRDSWRHAHTHPVATGMPSRGCITTLLGMSWNPQDGFSYYGPCAPALLAHEALWGPPPFGKRYACLHHGTNVQTNYSYVYTVGVAATYLVQTIHERTGALAFADDVEVTTSHWRWDGAGDPDASDFMTVEARLDGFWDDIKMARTTNITVREHRWYPAVVPPASPGSAIHITASGIVGTSTANLLPPQIATTLTFITDVRRRWGRFYIGGLTVGLNSASGRLNAGDCSEIAVAGAAAFFNSATNWRVQVFGAPTPNSLPVRSVRVDDVWDVMRSRRYGGATVRETRTLDT